MRENVWPLPERQRLEARIVFATHAERLQLRSDPLFALNPKCDFRSDIGMQRPAGFDQLRDLPVSTTMTPSRCSIAHA